MRCLAQWYSEGAGARRAGEGNGVFQPRDGAINAKIPRDSHDCVSGQWHGRLCSIAPIAALCMGLRRTPETLETDMQVNIDRRNTRLRRAMSELRTPMNVRMIVFRMGKTAFVALMLLCAVHVANENFLLLLILCGAAILAGDLIELLLGRVMFRKSGQRKEG